MSIALQTDSNQQHFTDTAIQTGTSLSGQRQVNANKFTTRFGHVASSRLTATKTFRAPSFFYTSRAEVCTAFFVFFFSNVVDRVEDNSVCFFRSKIFPTTSGLASKSGPGTGIVIFTESRRRCPKTTENRINCKHFERNAVFQHVLS